MVAGLASLVLTGRAGEGPVSRALSARVAARIADGWKVPREQVRLAWGRATNRVDDEGASFRVLGRGEDGWFVVVFAPAESTATAVRVRAGVERSVLVASRPLAAGASLDEGDVRDEVRVHWGAPASAPAIAPATGWEVRRPLREGDVLTALDVAAPALVLAGQPVRLEWERGGVQVSVMGIALNSARRGETVRARLEERPARLTATVTAPGTAVLATGNVR
jgi:flagella basal body P-ring formation protein FlgA